MSDLIKLMQLKLDIQRGAVLTARNGAAVAVGGNDVGPQMHQQGAQHLQPLPNVYKTSTANVMVL